MNDVDLYWTAFPIVVAKKTADDMASVTRAIGTGFFVAPHVLLTCWHCVADTLDNDSFYAINIRAGESTFRLGPITSVERDVHGTDMATCCCAWTPPRILPVAKVGADYGEEVWTFAYPYPDVSIKDGTTRFGTNGRYLRGYVTRNFYYQHPTLGRSDMYELDMPAPPGASGAPVLKKGTNEVVGMIIGESEISTVVAFASEDAVGVRTPETVKLHMFGIAYDHGWLLRLTTPHTGGMPLSQYVHV